MATLTTFTAGTPILSADVNANFTALNTEVGDAIATLSSSVGGAGNIGTGEDTLSTYTIPAGTLSAIGDGFEVFATGAKANTVNTKTVKFYLTGAAGSGTGITVNPTYTAGGGSSAEFFIHAMAVYLGSASWKIATTFQITSNNTPDFVLTTLVVPTAPNLALPLMFTGEATATSDIAIGWMMVRVFRAT